MSALLLDTHALLWLLIQPARVPSPTLDGLRDPRTELVVSTASAWEVATKVRIGQLDGAEPVVTAGPITSAGSARASCPSGAAMP